MITYPQIDPVAVSIGPLKVHWYGLMYMFGFAAAWWLGNRRADRPNSGWTREQVGDLVFYGAMGVILGGRIGYVLFYNFDKFLADPLWLFEVWTGGMSFHGGAIGVLVAFGLFARKTGKRYFQVADFMVPMVPIGLAAGRLGNFMNAELWGHPSNVPWAMIFPTDPMQVPRHPSQLYEFTLEGVVLFLVLWFYSARPRPAGAITGLFGVGYGVARITCEFFRTPDVQIGYLFGGWLTEGMLLSAPMVIIGAGMMIWAYRRHERGATV
ncbi:MAG: prolipoprotein diacylglyceryl transferase [Alcanivorax sp.]|nr:prolipoprotein diacylglyceryl transferase [Alcanivorax sp.]